MSREPDSLCLPMFNGRTSVMVEILYYDDGFPSEDEEDPPRLDGMLWWRRHRYSLIRPDLQVKLHVFDDHGPDDHQFYFIDISQCTTWTDRRDPDHERRTAVYPYPDLFIRIEPFGDELLTSRAHMPVLRSLLTRDEWRVEAANAAR